MDDAHACADTVREQCRIRIPSDEPAYGALRALFADELEMQGVGTYADICNDKRDACCRSPIGRGSREKARLPVSCRPAPVGPPSDLHGPCLKICWWQLPVRHLWRSNRDRTVYRAAVRVRQLLEGETPRFLCQRP